jgi:hypothetical protein
MRKNLNFSSIVNKVNKSLLVCKLRLVFYFGFWILDTSTTLSTSFGLRIVETERRAEGGQCPPDRFQAQSYFTNNFIYLLTSIQNQPALAVNKIEAGC